MPSDIPTLLTVGRIAELLGEPVHRVMYVLNSRPHITPCARAARLRLFDCRSVAMIRHELNAIDARRSAKNEQTAG